MRFYLYIIIVILIAFPIVYSSDFGIGSRTNTFTVKNYYTNITYTNVTAGTVNNYYSVIYDQSLNKSDNVQFQNVNVTGNFSAKRPYGMFSSTQTQSVAVINTAYPMTFNWTDDAYLVYKSNDNQNFSFGLTGDYLIELSIIVQSSTPGTRVYIWVQKNGVNIPRSTTIYDFKGSNANSVISVPFILDMNTTDKFRIMYAGDNTGVKIQYFTNTSFAPETPSAIMTISKISEITE